MPRPARIRATADPALEVMLERELASTSDVILSDAEAAAMEYRTAADCLRAAREHLELAALSMTVACSIEGDEDSLREADGMLEAGRQLTHALERQIARRALSLVRARVRTLGPQVPARVMRPRRDVH